MIKKILTPSLNWLLIFVFITVYLKYFKSDAHSWIFVSSCIAIIPLAGWLGKATEHLAHKVGEGLGGLLNATFGNAAELIIAIAALRGGLIDVVKASLTGSIIGNALLVLGASFFAGGLKFKIQKFDAVGASSQATMLTFASIALIVPAGFHKFATSYVSTEAMHSLDMDLSFYIALLLLFMYALGLIFSLKTHKDVFAGEMQTETFEEDFDSQKWGVGKAMSVLIAATAFIAWMSEILVGSVEHAAHSMGLSSLFIGVVVVAIVGNAAEHSTAIIVAIKNKMNLSVGIAIGSSVQIALFVAPLLVLLSYSIAPRPMNLLFSSAEVLAVVVSVHIVCLIVSDGKSNWFEGAQLLVVYALMALVFYFLPEAAGHVDNVTAGIAAH